MGEHSDCVFWEIFACDGGEQCQTCTKCIGVNDKGYYIIRDTYQHDVDEALEPVHKKWKEIFERGEFS